MSLKEHYNKEKLYGGKFTMAMFIAIIIAIQLFSKLIPIFGTPISFLAFAFGCCVLVMAIWMNVSILKKLEYDEVTRSAFAGMKPEFKDYLDIVIGGGLVMVSMPFFSTFLILGVLYLGYAVTTIITKHKSSKVKNG